MLKALQLKLSLMEQELSRSQMLLLLKFSSGRYGVSIMNPQFAKLLIRQQEIMPPGQFSLHHQPSQVMREVLHATGLP
jgi:hypothetical protein